MSDLRLDRNGLVATLTLDRPDARNALDRELMIELTQMFSTLAYDGTRVIVLTGAGTAFCAGADIEWMRRARDLEQDENVADAAIARNLFETIDACPRAVIAQVNGHRAGRRLRAGGVRRRRRRPSPTRSSGSPRPASA